MYEVVEKNNVKVVGKNNVINNTLVKTDVSHAVLSTFLSCLIFTIPGDRCYYSQVKHQKTGVSAFPRLTKPLIQNRDCLASELLTATRCLLEMC